MLDRGTSLIGQSVLSPKEKSAKKHSSYPSKLQFCFFLWCVKLESSESVIQKVLTLLWLFQNSPIFWFFFKLTPKRLLSFQVLFVLWPRRWENETCKSLSMKLEKISNNTDLLNKSLLILRLIISRTNFIVTSLTPKIQNTSGWTRKESITQTMKYLSIG